MIGGYTGLVSFVPTMGVGAFPLSISSVLNPNSEFDKWTGNAADGWTLTGGAWGGNPGANQVAADGSAGTGAVRLVGTSAVTATLTPAVTLTLNEWYEVEVFFSAGAVPGYYSFLNGSTQIFAFLGAIRRNRLMFNAALGTTFALKPAFAPADMVIDHFRVRHARLMPARYAPADGTYVTAFGLSPVHSLTNHDQMITHYRIQDNLNYCSVRCMWLEAQPGWQVQAFVTTNNVASLKLTVNGISPRPDKIRVVTSGSDHSVEMERSGVTTVLGTFTSSSFASATGVRGLWTHGIVPTQIAGG